MTEIKVTTGKPKCIIDFWRSLCQSTGPQFCVTSIPSVTDKKIVFIIHFVFSSLIFLSPCFFVDNFVLLYLTVYYNLHRMVFSIKWRTTQGTNSLSWVEHAKDFWKFLHFFFFWELFLIISLKEIQIYLPILKKGLSNLWQNVMQQTRFKQFKHFLNQGDASWSSSFISTNADLSEIDSAPKQTDFSAQTSLSAVIWTPLCYGEYQTKTISRTNVGEFFRV